MGNTSHSLSSQWKDPSDVFSVLLILGGDVIRMALVALSGGVITPVAFSFGWVAYAISALLSAISENRLVQQPPEISLLVMNLKSGFGRTNKSWLLARLMKTYDYWMPEEVRMKFRKPRLFKDEEEAGNLPMGGVQQPTQQDGRPVALCVAIYKWSEKRKAGYPAQDWVWWCGIATTAFQLGVSAVPFGLYGDWATFLVTAWGTILAYATGSLPHWRREKWHARKRKKDIGLTLGNGSKHVVVVIGTDDSLDLEDLAGGWTDNLPSTRVVMSVLAILWLALLVTSTGIQTNRWFLLAVGGLGMMQNIVVAGAPREPKSLGLPIELATMMTEADADAEPKVKSKMEQDADAQQRAVPAIFAEEKVMWTLMELESKFESFGRSLLREFFPSKLLDWEEEWWQLSDALQRRKLLTEARNRHYAKIRQGNGVKSL